ncbi:hypothetical protein BD408DRAFT_412869 [Parasitella parasitica]|nr:hypothetical protein BD408DRAFT_412869 [Parasitella parasitica]
MAYSEQPLHFFAYIPNTPMPLRQCAATKSQHLQLALLILIAFLFRITFPCFDPNLTTENRYWARLSVEAILFEGEQIYIYI